MRTVTAKRAAAILFHLAKSMPESEGIFLVPANACPVVPMSILRAGKKVEFVDIDNRALSISADAIEKRLLNKRKPPVAGIIFIRPYGLIARNTVDFFRLKDLSPTTLIVDDRCAAIPEFEDDLLIKTGADVYLYSTGYGKYVDLGVGGFAQLEPEVNYVADHLENASFLPSDYQTLDQMCKSQLAESNPKPLDTSLMQSLSWLDTSPLDLAWSEYKDKVLAGREKVSARKALAGQIYYAIIPGHIFLGNKFNDWRHQIVVEHKEALLKKIFRKKLFASGHYSTVATIFGSQGFPNSDHLHSRVINLFNDLYIDEPQIIGVAETVKDHVSSQ